MGRSVVAALCVLWLLGTTTAAVATDTATPAPFVSSTSSLTACPVTQPNGDMPPGSGNPDYIGGYGNEALWTNLWMWGKGSIPVVANPERPGETHGPGKWAWYRYIPGKLIIEGKRLDAPAPPLEAHIPEGYGLGGFQVSGLTFPTPGCWEVTGRVGDASLTFVVLVEVVGSSATPAAPVVGTPMPDSTTATIHSAPGFSMSGWVTVAATPDGGVLLRVAVHGPPDELSPPGSVGYATSIPLWHIGAGTCTDGKDGIVADITDVLYRFNPPVDSLGHQTFTFEIAAQHVNSPLVLAAIVQGGDPVMVCAELPLPPVMPRGTPPP